MMKELVILGGLTAFLLTLLAPADKAQDGSLDGPFTAEQEQRIEEIVRAYLLKRPETLIEARQALEAAPSRGGSRAVRPSPATDQGRPAPRPGNPDWR
jgi:hypothetical protein